jgi:hypothetical protein
MLRATGAKGITDPFKSLSRAGEPGRNMMINSSERATAINGVPALILTLGDAVTQ